MYLKNDKQNNEYNKIAATEITGFDTACKGKIQVAFSVILQWRNKARDCGYNI